MNAMKPQLATINEYGWIDGHHSDKVQRRSVSRMAPQIIGICGPKGVGKSTLAKAVGEHVEAQRIRFAKPLKSMIATLLQECGFTRGESWEAVDGSLKENPIADLPGQPTARHLLQTIGTEWGREHIGEEVWAQIAAEKAERVLNYHGDWAVIDDLRFPNEARTLRDRGAYIVEVRREGHDYSTEHASEGGIHPHRPDVIVENVGSPGNLAHSARSLLISLQID